MQNSSNAIKKAANGLIKVITMATEQDDDFKLTKYCVENGIRVSMGHSAATFEQAAMGIAPWGNQE